MGYRINRPSNRIAPYDKTGERGVIVKKKAVKVSGALAAGLIIFVAGLTFSDFYRVGKSCDRFASRLSAAIVPDSAYAQSLKNCPQSLSAMTDQCKRGCQRYLSSPLAGDPTVRVLLGDVVAGCQQGCSDLSGLLQAGLPCTLQK